MTFHISPELLFERAIVVWATILLFGLVSIGGLWLWRRLTTPQAPASESGPTLNSIEQFAGSVQGPSPDLAAAIERLAATIGRDRELFTESLRKEIARIAR